MTELWGPWEAIQDQYRAKVARDLYVLLTLPPYRDSTDGAWCFAVEAGDTTGYPSNKTELHCVIFEASSEAEAKALAPEMFRAWAMELAE